MPRKKDGRWIATKIDRELDLEICSVDGNVVKTMIFRGTGVCSDTCRKARDGDDRTGYGG